MDKNEILAKSREENKNKDIYEQEVLKQAGRIAVVVQMGLATIFFLIQIFVDKGINWGLWALVCSTAMTVNWVKYIKLHRRQELILAACYTAVVAAMSGCYIYNLISISVI